MLFEIYGNYSEPISKALRVFEMWRIRHINWVNNMLMNAEIQRIFLSNLHGSEQLQFMVIDSSETY
jgi:hypothetical protein